MQQLFQWMRRLVYPAAAILLLWAGYQVVADPCISDAAGKILVVYNGDETLPDSAMTNPESRDCSKLTPDMENLSEQALVGICNALVDQNRKKDGPAPLIELLNLRDSTSGDQNLNAGKVYEQLSVRVAHGSPLGVISLLTSPDSQAVVRFCRSLEIPLLLAIAANDELLSPAENTRGLVFRMMPTNKKQAEDIVGWIAQRKLERVAIFHEPNSYGEYLFRQINGALKRKSTSPDPAGAAKPEYSPVVFRYEVREQTEFADLMPELWCDQIDAIVYLGFATRATDLINKIKWYHADRTTTTCEAFSKHGKKSPTFDSITLLLSSGAYQADLDGDTEFRPRFSAFAMSPTDPTPRQAVDRPDSTEPKLVSSAKYGYDSYMLMAHFASRAKKKGNGSLREIFSGSSFESQTGHQYRFSESGELSSGVKNRYCGYKLASLSEPAPRSGL